MKLAMERDALHGALGRVAKCVGRSDNIPILGNVLLRAEGDTLTVSATDLDIVASSAATARVEREGAMAVPAKMLQGIIGRSASGSQVAMDADDDKLALALRVGRSRITMQGLPAGDFPDLPLEGLGHEFLVDAGALARLLGAVDFAVSSEETRYYLRGAFLHVSGASLRAVATDGHRLARCDIPAPLGCEGMPGVIIPDKTASEIIRLGKDMPGQARVQLGGAKFVIDFENGTRLVSKLVEGTFPDYERVIPSGNTKRATIDREAVTEAAARLAAVDGDGSILFDLSDDRLQLTIRNAEGSEGVDEMEVDYQGEPLAIRFAAKYVRETLAALDCDRFVASFDTPGSPALFEPNNDSNVLLVLMPRRN